MSRVSKSPLFPGKSVFCLFLLLWPVLGADADSWEASYSPLSLHHEYFTWGKMPEIQLLSLGYQSLLGFHYYNLHLWQPKEYEDEETGEVFYLPAAFWNGLFVTFQLEYKKVYGRVGIGLFLESFPDGNGRNLNFLFKTGYRIFPWLSVSYSHISNGYQGVINPGVDHISVNLQWNP